MRPLTIYHNNFGERSKQSNAVRCLAEEESSCSAEHYGRPLLKAHIFEVFRAVSVYVGEVRVG